MSFTSPGPSVRIRLGAAAGLTLLLLFALAGSARAASIWTPLASGTTEDITAVDYQSDASFFFATSNGKIFQKTGPTFTQRSSTLGVVFNDIAMRGANGLAVGNNGKVLRTTNSGVTWTDVSAGLPTLGSDCATALPGANLQSVRWASDTTAWIFGDGRTIDTYTVPAGTYAAKNGGTPCKVPDTITDAFFVDPMNVYFISESFGGIYFTSEGLATSPAAFKGRQGPNGFGAVDRLAGDPANPNRQWAVNDYPSATGVSFLSRTENGWANGDTWSRALNFGAGQDYTRPLDVAYNGGTVLEAGDAGQIVSSVDGASFFNQPADGALATKSWRTVSLADASHAAVGGVGGALVVTDRASTIPDIVPPTGTISGPAAVVAGKPATFTAAVADNAGGTGIDPNGFAWTTPGQTDRTGASTTFTFADPGPGGTSQTITLGFKDVAGNTGTATKTVSILRPAKPKRKHPGLTLKAKPKRDKHAPFKFTFSGAVKAPRGTSCAGKVKVSVAAGRRTLKRKTVKVSKKCTYKVKMTFKTRKSIRKAKKLKVSAVYGGNSKLTSAKKSTTVKTK